MENLTGVSMREYANFIHALSTRTASRNSSNFQSHFYLFSVGFMKGGKESKELCSVSGLGLRLHGRFSRNLVYCCMRVYLRRVLAVAEKKSLQLPQYRPERHHKLTVYATKGRIIFTCKSVLFFRVYQSSLDVTG